MRRFVAWPLLCATALLVGACASPTARFYTLTATAERAAGSVPAPLSVVVGPVAVPAAVDRPQIVVQTGANELAVDEYNRWASPLQDNVARVVAENLVALLGTSRVTLFGQSLATDVGYRVQIEIRSFESAPGKSAALDAVWSIRRMTDGKSEIGRTSVRESVADAGYGTLAAAHSRALARMSQDIADAIRVLDRAPR
jgi:hypothetical protein